MSLAAKKIGIDLGTANTIVWMEGKGIVFKEPSVIARDIQTGEILAVGEKAFQKIGNTLGNVVASRPLKDGVISDYETTVAMIRYFIKKTAKYSFQKPHVMISIPMMITEVEKRAIIDASSSAGAKDTHLIEETFAAAIGAGLPIYAPTGNLVVDIGAGTTSIATISLGGIVSSVTIPSAGNKMDEEIMGYLRKTHTLTVSKQTAESVKIAVGSADLRAAKYYGNLEVRGRDIRTGLPKKVVVSATVVAEAMYGIIQEIIQAIKEILEQSPPEIVADIIHRGIVLTGGGALLKDIEKVIAAEIKVPVVSAVDPLDCVVLGIGEQFRNFKGIKKILYRVNR